MCWQSTCGHHEMRPKYLKGFFCPGLQRDLTKKSEVKQGCHCTTNNLTQCILGEVGASHTCLEIPTHAQVHTQQRLSLSRLKGFCIWSVTTESQENITVKKTCYCDDVYPPCCMISLSHPVDNNNANNNNINLVVVESPPYTRPFDIRIHTIEKV